MKTKEELQTLKEEYEAITTKLKELSEEELRMVTGGNSFDIEKGPGKYEYSIFKEPNFDQEREKFLNGSK